MGIVVSQSCDGDNCDRSRAMTSTDHLEVGGWREVRIIDSRRLFLCPTCIKKALGLYQSFPREEEDG